MDSDGRTGLLRISAPEHAEHLALKEYATIKLMQVIAERDAACLERDTALAHKKAAINERDSVYIERDIAVAERDAAIIERDNAVIALDAARGHMALSWNHYKRQVELRGKDGTAMHASIPNVVSFGAEEMHTFSADSSMIGFVCNSDRVQPVLRQKYRPPKKEGSKMNRRKSMFDTEATEGMKADVKKKNAKLQQQDTHVHEGAIVPFVGQVVEPQLPKGRAQHKEPDDATILLNTPIPFCSCTGMNQPCYRWGNGGWQSACCTTSMSMHPLPINPKKRGYRVPGRKMSASAFQKLVKKLSQEGADVSQPLDLRSFWAKHGTNRYVTIK